MDIKRINKFLTAIAANNNRECFLEHKPEYQACKEDFEEGIGQAIACYSAFDEEIAHLQVKDCTYRFYRDIRFSSDKSPYKRHFGAYICAKGKKSLRGGYYIHVQPGHCILAVGSYYLPTNILTSCRNEIMGNIDEWRKAVENGMFIKTFGYPGKGVWKDDDEITPKGFGLNMLKKAPKDFPRDYEFLDYLRMKDYCAWVRVPDEFFEGDDWLQKSARLFQIAKPMMDMINSVIDDYE